MFIFSLKLWRIIEELHRYIVKTWKFTTIWIKRKKFSKIKKIRSCYGCLFQGSSFKSEKSRFIRRFGWLLQVKWGLRDGYPTIWLGFKIKEKQQFILKENGLLLKDRRHNKILVNTIVSEKVKKKREFLHKKIIRVNIIEFLKIKWNKKSFQPSKIILGFDKVECLDWIFEWERWKCSFNPDNRDRFTKEENLQKLQFKSSTLLRQNGLWKMLARYLRCNKMLRTLEPRA